MKRNSIKILVTGTPGTGKSSFCNCIFNKFKNVELFNVSEIVKSNTKLQDYFDEDLQTVVINDSRTRKFIKKMILSSNAEIIVLETHSASLFKKLQFDIVFVLRAPTEVLFDRLKKRNYTKEKIEENIIAEIMQVCLDEVREILGSSKVVEFRSVSESDLIGPIEILESLIN